MATKFTDFAIASSLLTGDYFVGHAADSSAELRITARNLSSSLLTMIRPTWNNGLTVFKGIDLDVTNTASDSSSLLAKLSIGGAEKAGIDLNGYYRIGASVVLKRSGTTTTLGTSSDTDLVSYGAFALNNTGNASLTLKADTDANSATATADILFDNNNGTTVGRISWNEANQWLALGYGTSTQIALPSTGGLTVYGDLRGTSGTYQITGFFGVDSTVGVTDWNDVSNARSGCGETLLLGNATNGPGTGNYYHPFSFEYSSRNGTGNLTQLGYSYNATGAEHMVIRRRFSGAWSNWWRTVMMRPNSYDITVGQSDGNVGIGHSDSPPNKFTVKHDEATNTWSSVSDAATDAVIKILGSNNATPYGVYLGYAAATGNVQGIQAGDGTSALPLAINPFGGVVSIGTLTANANAILDLSSTTKAFMPPRMTTTQKNAISTPTAGMVVYDSTLNKLAVYTGSAWEAVTSA